MRTVLCEKEKQNRINSLLLGQMYLSITNFMWQIFKSSGFTHISVTRTSVLTSFGERVAVCCGEHTDTQCGFMGQKKIKVY